MSSKIMLNKIITRFLLLWFSLWLLTTGFSSTVLAQDETNIEATPVADTTASTAPPQKGEQSPMDKTIADRQKAWLTIDGQAELAFYLDETSGKAHGGVLLIPKLNQHPATNGLINNLRHTLSDNHWHTLAVNMTGADPQQAIKVIAAGIAYLNTQGVYNIALLGEGAGGAQALQYAASLPPLDPSKDNFDQIRAVILVNANNKISSDDTETLNSLSKIKLPILDAYSNSDYRQQQLAKERKRAAQREMKTPYQQARLPQVSDYRQNGDNRITKRLRGWLDQNVAGFMVDSQ